MSSSFPQLLRDRIAASPAGCLPWAEVMDLALYHPGHGYYGRGPRRIGRSGDFFTAVSVGPVYGMLLASLAEEAWHSLGRPHDFAIVEQGAHDGQLMEDMARGLAANQSPLAASARWIIIEPNAAFREAQAGRLRPLLGGRLRWLPGIAELSDSCPESLLYAANELLDAFPVHRVVWTGGEWQEDGVAWSEETKTFAWKRAAIADPALAAEAARLPRDLAPGFTTEISLRAAEHIRSLASLPFRGAVLIADYGLDHDEFFAPTQHEGTLRRYHQHRMDGEVLDRLGECDLTSHIDFTRIIAEAQAAGMKLRSCEPQGRFLTRLAAGWLRSLDGSVPSAGTAAQLRQFQTLVHPGQMGASFRMCLLGRGMD